MEQTYDTMEEGVKGPFYELLDLRDLLISSGKPRAS
jgi:hypothetical protein